MEPEKSGNHSLGIGLDVAVVIFEDGSEELILFVTDCLQHVLSISCVIKERPTFALTGQGSHWVDLAQHQRGHKSIRTDTHDIVFILDIENFPYVVECVRCVVCERVDGRLVLFASKSSRDQLKIVLEFEVFGLFINHLLVPSYASYCHLNTNHHVQYHVPVIIPKKYHVSFSSFYLFMHILYRFLFLLLYDLLVSSIIRLVKLIE